MVAGLPRADLPILVRLRLRIVQKYVRNDKHPSPMKLRIKPLFLPGTSSMTDYPMPQGVSKGKTGLSTIARDGTKEPSGYDVPGVEVDRETHTTTYPHT